MNTYTTAILFLVFFAAFELDRHRSFLARVHDASHVGSGFCSGLILGSAFFVFIAQAIRATGAQGGLDVVLSIGGLGFVGALVAHRMLLIDHRVLANRYPFLGRALRTCGFSVALGFGFRISLACGSLISLAFISREFCSAIGPAGTRIGKPEIVGMYLVSMILAVIVAQVLPTGILPLASGLAIVGGIFVYVGASMLIPESHHAYAQWPTIGTTIAGALLVYCGVR